MPFRLRSSILSARWRPCRSLISYLGGCQLKRKPRFFSMFFFLISKKNPIWQSWPSQVVVFLKICWASFDSVVDFHVEVVNTHPLHPKKRSTTKKLRGIPAPYTWALGKGMQYLVIIAFLWVSQFCELGFRLKYLQVPRWFPEKREGSYLVFRSWLRRHFIQWLHYWWVLRNTCDFASAPNPQKASVRWRVPNPPITAVHVVSSREKLSHLLVNFHDWKILFRQCFGK